MPQNMELDVSVNLTGQQNANGTWSLNAVYSVSRSVPPSPNVVTADGAIDLTQMANTGGYSNSTVLKFTITPNVIDKDGNNAMVIFPNPRSNAVQFTAIADPVHPPAPVESEFTVSNANDDPFSLIFTDIDNSVGSYEYCLQVSCASQNNLPATTMVALDPPIKNRATG